MAAHMTSDDVVALLDKKLAVDLARLPEQIFGAQQPHHRRYSDQGGIEQDEYDDYWGPY